MASAKKNPKKSPKKTAVRGNATNLAALLPPSLGGSKTTVHGAILTPRGNLIK
jgi:hypothetical protein